MLLKGASPFQPWSKLKYLLLRGVTATIQIMTLFYSVKHLQIGDSM